MFVLCSYLILKLQNSMAILIYYILTAGAFLYYLYGNCIIFIVGVSLINYAIGKICKTSSLNAILTWSFNLAILFTSKKYNGYEFHTFYLPYYLEDNRGVLNWETYFNILFCRLVSYNMDYAEQLGKKQNEAMLTPVKKDEQWSEYRQRQESHLDVTKDFGIIPYFAYLFYVPLFVGGPVCSYIPFISYVKYGIQKEVSFKRLVWLTVAVFIYVIGLEIYLHLLWTVGMNEKGIWKEGRWETYSPNGELKSLEPQFVAVIGITTLTFMYMKFLIIWRMFRVMALWDGINPPENMNRCVNNNYLVSDFWRSWHRSLYMWILRYIYVPLGGSKSKVWSVWIIFTFIAMWHDLWWRWVAWAWINCGLIILEAILTMFVFPRIKWLERLRQEKKYTYAFVAALGGAISIITMVIANLAIMHGFDDTPKFIGQLFLQEGYYFFLPVVLVCLMGVVLVMIHIRDIEREDGDMKRY